MAVKVGAYTPTYFIESITHGRRWLSKILATEGATTRRKAVLAWMVVYGVSPTTCCHWDRLTPGLFDTNFPEFKPVRPYRKTGGSSWQEGTAPEPVGIRQDRGLGGTEQKLQSYLSTLQQELEGESSVAGWGETPGASVGYEVRSHLGRWCDQKGGP